MIERIRYGRVGNTRVPKNTLVTVRKDDTVYFGISRCRTSADRFNKEDGVKLAKLRAEVAQHGVAVERRIDDSKSLFVHRSGLFGQVNVDEITKLLSYFDDVDTLNLPNQK